MIIIDNVNTREHARLSSLEIPQVPDPFKSNGPGHAVEVAEDVFDRFDEDKNGSLPRDTVVA